MLNSKIIYLSILLGTQMCRQTDTHTYTLVHNHALGQHFIMWEEEIIWG